MPNQKFKSKQTTLGEYITVEDPATMEKKTVRNFGPGKVLKSRDGRSKYLVGKAGNFIKVN